MSFIRDSLCLKVDCHCRVIYVRTRMNEIEAMYEVSRIDVRVERVSTLTFLRNSSHIAYNVFTHINFTCERTLSYATVEIHPYLGRVLYYLVKTALIMTKQKSLKDLPYLLLTCAASRSLSE